MKTFVIVTQSVPFTGYHSDPVPGTDIWETPSGTTFPELRLNLFSNQAG